MIQAYLEFYERNPLYTSVALLTLKANRNFTQSAAYQVIRQASRPIVEAFQEGVEAGIFRSDLDAPLVRNMVLGFIEHLTTQWIAVGRPQHISQYRDTIHEMVMRAIEKRECERTAHPPDRHPGGERRAGRHRRRSIGREDDEPDSLPR